MYRITRDDGSIAYRTDLHSRGQIGLGDTNPNGAPFKIFTSDAAVYGGAGMTNDATIPASEGQISVKVPARGVRRVAARARVARAFCCARLKDSRSLHSNGVRDADAWRAETAANTIRPRPRRTRPLPST